VNFYLRLKDQAIVLGDRDIRIEPGYADIFYLIAGKCQYTEENSDQNWFFKGTKEQCQVFLDWILVTADEHRSDNYECNYPLTYIDAREYVEELTKEAPTNYKELFK
jgi:hypothetical protein